MLTVKHILPSGEELIHPTKFVNYRPALHANGDTGVCLLVDDRDGDVMRLDTGIAYVMNDSGATVAKYDLNLIPNGPFAPHGD